MPREAQHEAEETNLPVLASQVERFRHRLDYWVRRQEELEHLVAQVPKGDADVVLAVRPGPAQG